MEFQNALDEAQAQLSVITEEPATTNESPEKEGDVDIDKEPSSELVESFQSAQVELVKCEQMQAGLQITVDACKSALDVATADTKEAKKALAVAGEKETQASKQTAASIERLNEIAARRFYAFMCLDESEGRWSVWNDINSIGDATEVRLWLYPDPRNSLHTLTLSSLCLSSHCVRLASLGTRGSVCSPPTGDVSSKNRWRPSMGGRVGTTAAPS